MFIIRSISLLALACATISSAAPLDANTESPSHPAFPRPHGLGYHLRPHSHEKGVRTVEERDAYKSIPNIISVAVGTINPIVAKLKVDIKVVAKIDKKIVAEDLAKISVALDLAIKDLTVVVSGGDYLTHNGVVLTVKGLAQLLWGLLDLVFEILYSVVGAVGILDPDCGPIVIKIGGLVYGLGTTVFGLVGGLEAALILILSPDLAQKLAFLKYNNILALLHL